MKKLPSKLIPLIRLLAGADFKQAPIGCRSKPIKPARQEGGFTLIEIIIFIVLAGVFMAGIMSPFLTSVFRSGQPEIVASAAFLAAERLEQLQPKIYTDTDLSVGTHNDGTITLGSNSFTRQYVVSEVSGVDLVTPQAGSGYKKIVVTVYHSQLPAAGISITSLFTNYAG